jgi:predicted nucleic acid-binding protein
VRNLQYYLDTTIFNFAFADDAPERKQHTLRFLDELPLIAEGIYISEEVIREISKAPEPKRTELEGVIRRVNPSGLRITRDDEELAERYIREGVIPAKYRGDAIHIAVAVAHGIDVIVSWNFEHIVKLKTRVMVNGINRLLGYHDIEICSPEEVVKP